MANTHSDITLINATRSLSADTKVHALEPNRLSLAKWAYSTRRVARENVTKLLTGKPDILPGDLLLARVDRLRQHGRLELTNGRRAHLQPGNEIVIAAGNRYAPDQFHAVAPTELGACSLVAAGGIAGRVLCRHEAIKPATAITLVGALADDAGQPINLSQFAVPARLGRRHWPTVVSVCGTAMNSGKTATATGIITGLKRAGLRVSSAKVTGTGSGGDMWRAWDCGADNVVDFTDAGYASTYKLPLHRVERIMESLVAHLADDGMDVVVVEVADGLLQRESAELLASDSFRRMTDHVVFAANDALGAIAGAKRLDELGLPLRAISGAMTQAPLAVLELREAISTPVVEVSQLADADYASETFTSRGRRDEVA